MKKRKNHIALSLILSSLVLLLALQVLWLRNSYERSYFDLRRQTSDIFRNTVFALRDSLLIKSIEHMPLDSGKVNQFHFTSHIDSVMVRKDKNGQPRVSSQQIQIYLSTPDRADSVKKILRPLASRIQEGRLPEGNRFIVRVGNDSLSTDTLTIEFQKALAAAGLRVHFQIRHAKFFPPLPMELSERKSFARTGENENEAPHHLPRTFSDYMPSDWVRFDPVHRYSVVLSGFRPYLLKEITPQILFSAFLTLLTSAAFVVMYRSTRAQQRLMDLKNDFISNITHELKTPITTVGVAIEALKNFQGMNNPALTEEYLTIAQNELNRLTILTDNVLRTAVLEDKGVPFNPEPVAVDKIVQQVLSSMKLLFDKQKANVTLEMEGDDFSVSGSNVHLTNVVYNLLDNALKYSGGNPEIKVLLREEATNVILSVKDNGIGIAPEYRKRVFEKFFRVPTGDVHNIKGYGLGLSYVESVVKSHDGTIRVESEPGKGSNFIVELPK
jgi:two-component system, OmpR family, phosphate regulon sensor histidine kinase PhoR